MRNESCLSVRVYVRLMMLCNMLMLEADNDIVEIRCNVQLEGMDYTSDFLCVKANGEYMVRECVYRKLLTKPMTMKMLESSRQYWMDVKNVKDWGLVVDEEK